MNQLKKLFAVAALTACVLPVAAQYPVIPDSVKIRGEGYCAATGNTHAVNAATANSFFS